MEQLNLAQIRSILGFAYETSELHARRNLNAALIDIEQANGQADEVCKRTIRRVLHQLAEVEKILG